MSINILKDGFPFYPKIFFFGFLVGAVCFNNNIVFIELFVAAVGINAATAQLALIQVPNEVNLLGVLILTLGLNLKLSAYTASIWPHLRHAPWWKIMLSGALTTDSSWICCQYAASKGELNADYALNISIIFTSLWLFGCVVGYFFSSLLTEDDFYKFGLDSLAILSISLIVSSGLKKIKRNNLNVVGGSLAGVFLYFILENQNFAMFAGAALVFAMGLIKKQ